MRNGGGAIMAIGRASGERRVERAIIDALDSPLLYGNDIGKAKRILFNIYASEKAPFFVPELSEIAEFFDQLDPNIDVIWGTAVDNSLDDDAKVIILAADMDDDIQEQALRSEYKQDDNGYYESLIPKLYKPFRRNKTEQEEKPEEKEKVGNQTVGEEVPKEDTGTTAFDQTGDLQSGEDFTNEDKNESKETELAKSAEEKIEKPQKPVSMVERWKRWLERKITEVVEDE